MYKYLVVITALDSNGMKIGVTSQIITTSSQIVKEIVAGLCYGGAHLVSLHYLSRED